MAIPGQKNINIGQPNQSANSDSLFDAFTTVQNNFTTLFSASSPITSLTAGPGINVSNSSTSSYQVINTGVTSLIAGNNITITSVSGTPGSNGSLIISSTGGNGNGGGVTSVGVVSNSLTITNTPILSSGNINIELANVANLVAGTYRNPNVTIDTTGRVISIANGVATGVTSVGVIAGNGISVSGSPVNGNSGNNTGAGNITVTNTGVTSLVAGTGIVLSAPNGVVTISSTGGGGGGTGTVTSIGVSSNTLTVTGSPIVSAGTISVNLPANLSTNSFTANSANIPVIESSNLWVSVENAIPITATVYSNVATGDSLNYRRARGNTSSPQAVQLNDQLLGIRAQGYTAFNQFQPAGGLIVTANGTPATSSSLVPSDVSIAASTTSNTFVTFRFLNTGNAVIPGSVTTITAGNSSPITTQVASRARNSITTPSNIISGDFVYRLLALGYTGNGLSSVGGMTGYSTAGSFEIVADNVPSSNGGLIPSNAYIRTVSTSNNVNILNFSSTGNLSIPGVFVGNGAGLSDLVASNITGTVANANYASFAGTVTTSSQPNITSLGTLSTLTVSGIANIGGNLNVSGTINGNVVGNISGNIVVPGANTEILFNSNGSAGTSANLTFSGSVLSVVGNINATAFAGNGAGLTNIAGANVTGAVAFATTANSVAGANVTGTVALATVAATANSVAGANVTGTVANATYATTAGTANSVAGANVTGTVANATYATTAGSANSVAGANVTGTVANATYATTAGTANSVAGANVSGAVAFATTANSVAGANVTGTVANATYATTAGSATTAGTVTTAAQPNITSVGTLTSLSVSGTMTGNAAGLANIPAANIVGEVNNNITVQASANTTANVGNIVTLTINGVTYQLLAA